MITLIIVKIDIKNPLLKPLFSVQLVKSVSAKILTISPTTPIERAKFNHGSSFPYSFISIINIPNEKIGSATKYVKPKLKNQQTAPAIEYKRTKYSITFKAIVAFIIFTSLKFISKPAKNIRYIKPNLATNFKVSSS